MRTENACVKLTQTRLGQMSQREGDRGVSVGMCVGQNGSVRVGKWMLGTGGRGGKVRVKCGAVGVPLAASMGKAKKKIPPSPRTGFSRLDQYGKRYPVTKTQSDGNDVNVVNGITVHRSGAVGFLLRTKKSGHRDRQTAAS